MASKLNISEADTLEQYRVALENAELQLEISSIMTELGYDAAVISNGKIMLEETRQAYYANKTEDDETSEAYADFSNKKSQLESIFTLHRKKAKVVYRKDSLTADRLSISGSMPRTYIKWLEAVKKFYSEALADTDIQSKLSRLNITMDDLSNANTLINDLEIARAEYLREKGESQDATKTKDAAFAKVDDWMSEF